MKLKDGVIKSEVAGAWYLVDSGAVGKRFNGMVKLNETGALLVDCLSKDIAEEELVQALCDAYAVSPEQAAADCRRLIQTLQEVGLLDG